MSRGSTATGISVVIPCYQSQDTIRPLVERLQSVLEVAATDYEIILVVDGSPDGTWEVVKDLAGTDRIRGIELMRNFGQHNALMAGILKAEKGVIVTMDDDLQHGPEDLPRLLAALTPDVDLVYGVPETETRGLMRNFASRLVKRVMALTLGVAHAERISAFRAFRRELIRGFADVHDSFVSVDVVLSWSTTRIASVDIPMNDRRHGQSGYNLRSLITHTFNMLTGYSIAPLKVVTVLGFATAFLGFALLVAVLFLFVTGRTSVAGFTSIASMVALFAGAQMTAIGILGEYLGRLHFRSMQRPPFLIRQEVTSHRPASSGEVGPNDMHRVE